MRRAFIGVAVAGLSCVAAFGQPATENSPTFEVASVKPSVRGTGFHNAECSGDRFIAGGLRLPDILRWAYDLQGSTSAELIQRIPESIRTKAYDIQARAAAPVASESQCRLMVQTLLADRFKLAFHYETRDAELTDLLLARSGPKMRKALPTDEGSDINIVVDGTLVYTWAPIADPDTRARTKGLTMQDLAQRLPTASLPVVDKTGLEGRYRIDLRYSTKLAADQDPTLDPPLDVALARLGLRLEKHKGSIRVPVLDHIEPPAAN